MVTRFPILRKIKFEYLGWISAALLISCGVPELYSGLRSGTVGATWGLLILWFMGEVTGALYCIKIKKLPLLANYGINTILVGSIILVKLGVL